MSEPQTTYRCDGCRRIVALRIADVLVIYVRHDGAYHETRIPLESLTGPPQSAIHTGERLPEGSR